MVTRLSRTLEALTVAAIVALAFAAWRRAPVAFDDAFISYRYAENLVRGHGLVFNPGERVEGYTNFLWVLLAAAAIRAGRDPHVVTRAVGVGAYLVTVGVLAWFGLRLGGRRLALRLLLASFALALVLPFGPAALAGSGLETSFAGMLFVLAGLCSHGALRWTPALRWLSAGLLLVLCLVRLDGVLAVVATAAAVVAHSRRKGARWGQAVSAAALYVAPVAIGLGAWLAWKTVYYGGILPNSFHAKAADLWSWRAGIRYLYHFVFNSPQTALLMALAAAGTMAGWRSEWRGLSVYAAGTLLLQVAYIVKVGGDFMYYRFAFEVYPLLVGLAAAGLASLCRDRKELALPLGLAGLGLCLTPPVYETKHGMQSLEGMNGFVVEGREVGRRLRESLPPDTILATTLAGTIPYESRLQTIDQWGLNDRHVARLPVTEIGFRGHVKRAPHDYLQSRGVNLYIDHPVICSCENPCRESLPNVFVRLGGDRCLRTWYMTPKESLTRHVCAHPEDFLLNNVTCPPPNDDVRRTYKGEGDEVEVELRPADKDG